MIVVYVLAVLAIGGALCIMAACALSGQISRDEESGEAPEPRAIAEHGVKGRWE